MPNKPKIDRNTRRIALAGGMLLFAVVLYRNAWLSDDAYITFRTVDNFIQGYGLTWNAAERVQAYTHPLWMFLLSAFYFFSREIYYTSLVISLAVSLAAVFIMTGGIARDVRRTVLVLLILLFSKAFMDYSTSGLENPLTHLLLASFLYLFLVEPARPARLVHLSLLAALLLINRMDTLLLVLPVLVFEYRRAGASHVARAGRLAIGFLPFFAWEAFSLFYYGFPFPNTAYAKLNTGIPQLTFLKHGLLYLYESLRLDYLTLPVILVSLVCAFISRDRKLVVLAWGVVLYLFYVVKIGGDFMAGRFLTAPLLVAAAIATRLNVLEPGRRLAGSIIAAAILGLVSSRNPFFSGADYGRPAPGSSNHVMDERGFYYQDTGLLRAKSGTPMPTGQWASQGMIYKQMERKFVHRTSIGMAGFFAGQGTYILDALALADPLLSKFPLEKDLEWSIGHYLRFIPYGYIRTLKTGENSISNPPLKRYYDRLTLLVRGGLFSRERVAEIIRFNLGLNDHLLDEYNESLKLKNVYGVLLDPATPAFEWLVLGLGYDSRGRLDSSSVVHMAMVENKVELTEEEGYAWGLAMNNCFRKYYWKDVDKYGLGKSEITYLMRVFNLLGEDEEIVYLYHYILPTQMPVNVFLDVEKILGFCNQTEILKFLANLVLTGEMQLENPGDALLNLVTFCDISGLPAAGSEIYMKFENEKPESTPEVKAVCLEMMKHNYTSYLQKIQENPFDPNYYSFFMRYFLVLKDQTNLNLLLSYLPNCNFEPQSWAHLIRLARSAGDERLGSEIGRLALQKSPGRPEILEALK
ncbi:MAG: hypothetical protein V1794_14050 [Candidatus Glassbacteria bacterium]